MTTNKELIKEINIESASGILLITAIGLIMTYEPKKTPDEIYREVKAIDKEQHEKQTYAMPGSSEDEKCLAAATTLLMAYSKCGFDRVLKGLQKIIDKN